MVTNLSLTKHYMISVSNSMKNKEFTWSFHLKRKIEKKNLVQQNIPSNISQMFPQAFSPPPKGIFQFFLKPSLLSNEICFCTKSRGFKSIHSCGQRCHPGPDQENFLDMDFCLAFDMSNLYICSYYLISSGIQSLRQMLSRG